MALTWRMGLRPKTKKHSLYFHFSPHPDKKGEGYGLLAMGYWCKV